MLRLLLSLFSPKAEPQPSPKKRRRKVPAAKCLQPGFSYRSSVDTCVADTFKRAREAQKPAGNVEPIKQKRRTA